MMELTPSVKINELLDSYPFLLDFLVDYNPKFAHLKNKIMRATMGRMATLSMAADMGGMPIDKLLSDIEFEIKKQAQDEPVATTEALTLSDDEKVGILKELILDLHKGADFKDVKARFDNAIKGVEASQIAAMEEQLIRDGMPAEEIQRLCDLHVSVFETALEQKGIVETAPGHPVNSYMEENKLFTEVIRDLDSVVSRLAEKSGDALTIPDEHTIRLILEKLAGLELHYVRKENQLFPYLEKHNITGPSQVMWGIHDEIRGMLKELKAALADKSVAGIVLSGPKLSRASIEMIYKENTILFPMTMETFSDDEWLELKRGEDELGYAFITPGTEWPGEAVEAAEIEEAASTDKLKLDTGVLSLDQVNLMLKNLPVEFSFVDVNDELRYYSNTKDRIFPRSPGLIGRKVQNCHPPKSVHIVERILSAFKSGEKDSAAFWIDIHSRKIHISYYAIRDNDGVYQGTVEMTQDITDLTAIDGEQRLLDWKS